MSLNLDTELQAFVEEVSEIVLIQRCSQKGVSVHYITPISSVN